VRRRLEKVITLYKNGGMQGLIYYAKYFFSYKLENGLNDNSTIYRRKYAAATAAFEKIFAEEKFEAVVVFDSRVGWNIPLFQRPQHMFYELTKKGFLLIYRSNRHFDKEVKLIKKQKDLLYVVDIGARAVMDALMEKLEKVNCPKLLSLYSTDVYLTPDYIEETYKDRGFKMVYEYIDELSHEISGSLPDFVFDRHKKIIEDSKNTVILTSADKLYEEVKEVRGTEKLAMATNGVMYDHWTKTYKREEAPEKIKLIMDKGNPIIGYYGALAKWFDYDLLKKISKERPNYEIVLIGFVYDRSMQDSRIERLPNVHYLGIVDYQNLCSYAYWLDVLTIPFLLNDITESTSPVKLFEYMALNKPIVTTDMRECRKYESVMIGKSHDEFIELLDKALKMEKTDPYFQLLKKEALENTWEMKAKVFHDKVLESFL